MAGAVEATVEEAVARIVSLVTTTGSGVAFVVELVAGVDVSVLVGMICLTGGVGVQLLIILVTDTGSKMEANENKMVKRKIYLELGMWYS